MAPTCPSDSLAAVDQSSFWGPGNLNWDEHQIGWAVSGGCAVLVRLFTLVRNILAHRAQTVLISMVSVLLHCR